MKRTARTLLAALGVKRPGDGQGVGIHFDYRVHAWTAPVDGFDSGKIFVRDGGSSQRSGIHCRLQIGNGVLVQFKRGYGRSLQHKPIRARGQCRCDPSEQRSLQKLPGEQAQHFL